MLTISFDKLAYIIAKAREYDAEVPVDADAVAGSNAADDGASEVLFDTADNPTEAELRDAIDGLSRPEREELLALLFLGRGDFDAAGWREALLQARDSVDETATEYL